MKIYGIYIGYDFVSIAVRDIDVPTVTPLAILPVKRTQDRQAEVARAFKEMVARKKILGVKNPSIALLSFESPENVLFTTPVAGETPDLTEMASWEMYMRTGEDVKDYCISCATVHENSYLVAASKIKDIEFYTKLVKQIGLKVVSIEPPLVAFLNIFELNYDTEGENLLAVISCHKITVAYVKDGVLADVAQNVFHLDQLVSSQDVMKIRAEISDRNSISPTVPFYVTGDLLADKNYADFVAEDLLNASLIDPFKCVKAGDNTDAYLMEKYAFAFGAAVSLSQKAVDL